MSHLCGLVYYLSCTMCFRYIGWVEKMPRCPQIQAPALGLLNKLHYIYTTFFRDTENCTILNQMKMKLDFFDIENNACSNCQSKSD